MWFILILLCSSLNASELETHLRFHSYYALNDEISTLVKYKDSIIPKILGEAGISLSLSNRLLETLSGQFGIEFLPFEWLSGELRFYNSIHFPEHHSISSILFLPSLNLKLFFDFIINFSVGWYENIYYLTNISLLPFVRGADFYDRDFLASIKFIKKINEVGLLLEMATFDEKAVFRLNNPFIRIGVSLPVKNMLTMFYVRYKMLLGFGRVDELMFGMSLRIY